MTTGETIGPEERELKERLETQCLRCGKPVPAPALHRLDVVGGDGEGDRFYLAACSGFCLSHGLGKCIWFLEGTRGLDFGEGASTT